MACSTTHYEIDLVFIGTTLAFAEIRSAVLKSPIVYFNVPLLMSFNIRQEKPNKSLHESQLIEQPLLEEKKTNNNNDSIVQLIDSEINIPEDSFLLLIKDIEEALSNDIEPELCQEGVNGTYFLKNMDGENIAVFKPKDEEGMSPSNPKNSSSSSSSCSSDGLIGNLEKGIPQGEAALREVAAFLLDKHNGGFSGVPCTQMARINSSYFPDRLSNDGDSYSSQEFKEGSLQVFVESDGSSGEIGSSLFPRREVHKIGILDIMILNSDRHEGNVLFQEMENGTYKLVPIDHGYSLPTSLGKAWFDWLNWPQARQPFDKECLEHIARINVESNSHLLREIGISEESINIARISTTFLKKCAAKGLNLYQIGSMVSRVCPDQPSDLEEMYNSAYTSGELDLAMLESIMDEFIVKSQETKRK